MKRIWNGDIIIEKFNLFDKTYIIAKCEPGDIDWPEGGYGLYVYDKEYRGKWKQVAGSKERLFLYAQIGVMVYNYLKKRQYPYINKKHLQEKIELDTFNNLPF